MGIEVGVVGHMTVVEIVSNACLLCVYQGYVETSLACMHIVVIRHGRIPIECQNDFLKMRNIDN